MEEVFLTVKEICGDYAVLVSDRGKSGKLPCSCCRKALPMAPVCGFSALNMSSGHKCGIFFKKSGTF